MVFKGSSGLEGEAVVEVEASVVGTAGGLGGSEAEGWSSVKVWVIEVEIDAGSFVGTEAFGFEARSKDG